MTAPRVLVRHWRRRGMSRLAARHPARIMAAASPQPTVAAVACLAGLLLAVVVVALAGKGWSPSGQDVTTVQRLLVALLLLQLSLSGAVFLVQRTLPRPVHTVVTALWLLPLALTTLMVGGAGTSANESVLFIWGLYGLALTLWVISRFQSEPRALALCYGVPLVLLAVWSAVGPDPQTPRQAGLTAMFVAAAAIVLVPGMLVARGVSDLPRVHRWASGAELWFAGRSGAIAWLVGAKLALLMVYLGFARWRFPEQDFVPGSAAQWAMALAGALFVMVPMRMNRSRTLTVERLGRGAAAVGGVIGGALAFVVTLALGAVTLAGGRVWAALAVVLLFSFAAAAARSATPRVWRRAAMAMIIPVALIVGFLSPSVTQAQPSAPMTLSWLIKGLLVGGSLGLVVVGWLAWRQGELWWGVRAVAFVGVWIVLLWILRRTGTGLAGVDIVLTGMLVAAAVWVRRHPRSRVVPIEVLALCALPVIVIYGPDLVAGGPAAARPMLVVIALAAPGAAALWRHIGLSSGEMSARHTAGLAGLGAMYAMVGACLLVLGTTSTETLSDLAQALLSFLVIPLSVLLIALLEGGRPPAGVSPHAPHTETA